MKRRSNIERGVSNNVIPPVPPIPALCAMRYAQCAMHCSFHGHASRTRSTVLALCALLFASMGCGYHFRSTGEPIGISIESIAIPLMASTASDPGFEADFTRVLRNEFISHAKVPLLSPEEARYLVIGHIHDIRTDPQSYDFLQRNVQDRTVFFEETNRTRLRLSLDVSLVERSTGKVIWHEEAMETRANYDIGPDPLLNQYNKRLALERIARTLAQRIYMKTMERF